MHSLSFFFQFPNSLRVPMKNMAVFMATYSEYFYSNENKLFRLLRVPHTFLKYLLSPDALSKRLVEITENAQVDYGRSLLDMFEMDVYGIYQAISEHKIGVNGTFKIAPNPLQVHSEVHGRLVDIPVPSSHIGVAPIHCRLLSKQQRKGMVS